MRTTWLKTRTRIATVSSGLIRVHTNPRSDRWYFTFRLRMIMAPWRPGPRRSYRVPLPARPGNRPRHRVRAESDPAVPPHAQQDGGRERIPAQAAADQAD